MKKSPFLSQLILCGIPNYFFNSLIYSLSVYSLFFKLKLLVVFYDLEYTSEDEG